jgi:hypothetical protein
MNEQEKLRGNSVVDAGYTSRIQYLNQNLILFLDPRSSFADLDLRSRIQDLVSGAFLH